MNSQLHKYSVYYFKTHFNIFKNISNTYLYKRKKKIKRKITKYN